MCVNAIHDARLLLLVPLILLVFIFISFVSAVKKESLRTYINTREKGSIGSDPLALNLEVAEDAIRSEQLQALEAVRPVRPVKLNPNQFPPINEEKKEERKQGGNEGEESKFMVGSGTGQRWVCSKCTFHNRTFESHCFMCRAEPPLEVRAIILANQNENKSKAFNKKQNTKPKINPIKVVEPRKAVLQPHLGKSTSPMSNVVSSKQKSWSEEAWVAEASSIPGTWPNALALSQIIFEALQLLLIPVLLSGSGTHSSPSGLHGWMVEVGNVVLTTHPLMMAPLFYVGLACSIIWFIIISLPSVVEEMMEWAERGTFAENQKWIDAANFFGNTLFSFTITSLLKPLAFGLSSSATVPAHFIGGAAALAHDGMLAATCIALIFFALTTYIVSSTSALLQQQSNPQLSLRSPLAFLMGHRLFLAATVGSFLLQGWLSAFRTAPLATVLACCVASALWSSFYGRLTGSSANSATLITFVRASSAVGGALTSVLQLAGVTGNYVAFVVLGWGVAVAISSPFVTAWAFKHAREARRRAQYREHSGEASISTLQQRLLSLEEQLRHGKLLTAKWTGDPGPMGSWVRSVTRARYPRDLANGLLELEKHMTVGVLQGSSYYSEVLKWRKQMAPSWSQDFHEIERALDAMETHVEMAMVDVSRLIPARTIEEFKRCVVFELPQDYGEVMYNPGHGRNPVGHFCVEKALQPVHESMLKFARISGQIFIAVESCLPHDFPIDLLHLISE